MFAAGLGVAVLLAFAYTIYFGAPLWPRQPAPLPKIDHMNAISPSEITVVDGDTIKARGRTIRLVGFDAAETGLNARCPRERELGERATAQLRSLVAGGSLELRMVPCACPPGTEGMHECNYGRACGYLLAYGRDVGTTMIQAMVARPYICGATSCPPRGSWC
jgi:endonuclease YncB( thermonuclease family)